MYFRILFLCKTEFPSRFVLLEKESRGKRLAQLAVLALQKNNEKVFLSSRPVLFELDANCETLETNNIEENIVSEKCQEGERKYP